MLQPVAYNSPSAGYAPQLVPTMPGPVMTQPPVAPAPAVPSGPPHDAEGEWQLEEVFFGPELHQFPLKEKVPGAVTVKISKNSQGAFDLAFLVGNTMKWFVTLTGRKMDTFEGITLRPGLYSSNLGFYGMSTTTGGAAELEQILNQCMNTMPGAFRWMVTPGQKLRIIGATIDIGLTAAGDKTASRDVGTSASGSKKKSKKKTHEEACC
eukprot:TRINITY_DN7915_c0_g1_i1.p1 TRINITY_DN7915_c0_g1~~TRINITY_DN7915_c0_g1_i1.p1  ORF type:complete len:232 (+),score=60.08 TRINITY_DN7915_c0_g1_i1:71-697(+)